MGSYFTSLVEEMQVRFDCLMVRLQDNDEFIAFLLVDQ